MLCFPAAPLLALFLKWWVGLIAHIIGLVLLGAIRDSAAKFVMQQAIDRGDSTTLRLSSEHYASAPRELGHIVGKLLETQARALALRSCLPCS